MYPNMSSVGTTSNAAICITYAKNSAALSGKIILNKGIITISYCVLIRDHN